MIQDTEKTKVIFRQFKDDDHAVIAFFPELPGDNNPHATCMSYMHIGQHGSASFALVWETRLARPSNYADLKAELESLGYNLQICYRFTRKHYEMRRAAIAHLSQGESNG